MTDEQLNHLIEFLSRQKENIFLELKHVKSERDACVADRDAYRAERDEYKQKLIDNEQELARKDRIIKSKNKQLEKKDKKISDLQERLDDANENRYGDKQQRSKSKKSDGAKGDESSKGEKGQNNTQSSNNPDSGDVDRTRQEEECDGKTPQEAVTESKSDKKVKSSATGITFNPENRPEAYNTMKLCGLSDIKIKGMETNHRFDRSQLPAGSIIKASRIEKFFTMRTVLVCETCEKLKVKLPHYFFYDEGSRGRKVLTDFLGDAELEAIMTDGYNAYNFLDGELSIDHLYCLAHSRAKFIKAHKLGRDLVAKEIIELFDELYRMEREYKQSGFSPQQIYAARQSPETEVVVRKLHSVIARELTKSPSDRSYYMQEALNYFDHFKEGLFLYRTNGNYPIDNNIAERQVRPFAAMRKVIEHFGSDEGAEKMSAYLSIVSTVLMSGASVWRFFGDFFEDMITGGKKHLALLNLGLG